MMRAKTQKNILPAGVRDRIGILDAKRSRLVRMTLLYCFLFVAAYVPLVLAADRVVGINRRVVRIASLPVAYYLYCRIKRKKSALDTEFYSEVTSSVIARIDKDWEHHPDAGTNPDIIARSRLIRPGSAMEVRNRISGLIGKTGFEFSEVKVIRNGYIPAKLPRTIFHGYFLVFDFNKRTRSRLYIRPRPLRDFGDASFDEPPMRSDTPEFDRAFSVYCADEVHARYVLTPSFMARLLDLPQELRGRVSLLIEDSRMYVAIRGKGTFLEPELFRRMRADEIFDKHMRVFSTIGMLTDELKLNTRIWTV